MPFYITLMVIFMLLLRNNKFILNKINTNIL